jgi:GTP cyclohydrolase I
VRGNHIGPWRINPLDERITFMLDEKQTLQNAVLEVGAAEAPPRTTRPSRAAAEEAVRTMIRWAGDDPGREGLMQTPARVVRAFEEWFAGYQQRPEEILARTFSEVANYDEPVLLRDIQLQSTCEHHMAPIRGVAHIAYLPSRRVVGISKLARLVDVFSRRLQIQERLTSEIAEAIERVLQPLGVAVVIEAQHECMSSRGVRKHGSALVTHAFRGVYRQSPGREQALCLFRGRQG